MNKEANVMTKEVTELFEGKYCDISICTPIMEEQDIRFCAVGYDEKESLFIIDKNTVHFELDSNEIDNVEVDDEKELAITLTFTDGTVIVIRPIEDFETKQRYAHELLMLEIIRDRYKRELFDDRDDETLSLEEIKTLKYIIGKEIDATKTGEID